MSYPPQQGGLPYDGQNVTAHYPNTAQAPPSAQFGSTFYPYAPPYYPPPPPPPPPPPYNAHEKFNPRPKYQDLWAAIFFLCDIVAFIILSIIALRNYAAIQRLGSAPVQSVTLNWSTIWLFMICVGVGLVLSASYLALAQKYPEHFIRGTFVAAIALSWILTIYFFSMRFFSLAIIFAILSVLYTFSWFWWKSMIPFSSLILQTITSITQRYKGMILVAFLGLIVQALFTIWWIFTITAAYQVWYPAACKQRPAGNMPASSARCDNSRFVVIVIFLLFTYYWVSQTIFTWVHVTTSGVFASYYFLEGTEQGVPPSPTIQSAKRASTTSLGSVCLGSLLVALLQTIRALLRMAAQETDNPFGAFCAACAEVIIGCIEGLLQYFNFYAYTQVAIYGKSFWQAAKDTWELIKDRGVEAIINDNLIGNVVLIGSILVGMLTALFGYLYTIIIHPSFNRDGGFTALIIVLSFIIGFQMLSVIGSVILSGTATTFVCLAEDPRALERTKLNLYRAIIETYPNFARGLHV